MSEELYRADRWYNTHTGLGTADDKTSYFGFAPDVDIPYFTLKAMYETEPLARVVCDAIVADATRQGFAVAGAEKLVLELQERFNLWTKLYKWMQEARLYGGGGILVRADDGTDWSDGSKLRMPARLRGFDFVAPQYLTATEVDRDVLSLTFGQPTRFTAMLPRFQTSVALTGLHRSRFIFLEQGNKLSDEPKLFGPSVLNLSQDVLASYRLMMRAISVLVSDNNQSVYKIKDLNEIIAAAGSGQELLRKRFAFTEAVRSTVHAILLDADNEEFERKTSSVTELSNLIEKFAQDLAAATQMPITRLFGQSPSGLNATGESDTRMWYDRVSNYRTDYIEPIILQILRLASEDPTLPSIEAESVDSLSVQWPSLWQFSPQEIATVRNQVAQTDVAYIGAGVYTAEEVATARSQPNGWMKEVIADLGTDEDEAEPTEADRPEPLVERLQEDPGAEAQGVSEGY